RRRPPSRALPHPGNDGQPVRRSPRSGAASLCRAALSPARLSRKGQRPARRVKAIDAPLRQVRHEFGGLRKKKQQQTGRTTSMFASRDSYSYTDEELAEYERQEAEASKTRRNKPRTILGDAGGEVSRLFPTPNI